MRKIRLVWRDVTRPARIIPVFADAMSCRIKVGGLAPFIISRDEILSTSIAVEGTFLPRIIRAIFARSLRYANNTIPLRLAVMKPIAVSHKIGISDIHNWSLLPTGLHIKSRTDPLNTATHASCHIRIVQTEWIRTNGNGVQEFAPFRICQSKPAYLKFIVHTADIISGSGRILLISYAAPLSFARRTFYARRLIPQDRPWQNNRDVCRSNPKSKTRNGLVYFVPFLI